MKCKHANSTELDGLDEGMSSLSHSPYLHLRRPSHSAIVPCDAKKTSNRWILDNVCVDVMYMDTDNV